MKTLKLPNAEFCPRGGAISSPPACSLNIGNKGADSLSTVTMPHSICDRLIIYQPLSQLAGSVIPEAPYTKGPKTRPADINHGTTITPWQCLRKGLRCIRKHERQNLIPSVTDTKCLIRLMLPKGVTTLLLR